MIAELAPPARRMWLADFAAVTVLGAFLGLLGPFGSYLHGSAWQRIGYWTATSWLGFALGVPLIAAGLKLGRGRRLAALVGYATLASALLGLASWAAARTIWPALRSAPGPSPLVWWLQSLSITVGYLALFVALRRRPPAPSSVRPVAPAPAKLQAAPEEVLCLQMEDHYVRVHTASGSRLVLATMSQAVAALGRAPGLRVHRSWWVADAAVAGVLAEGRNLRLALINGVTAPVARSRVAAVRQAGWLNRPADPTAAWPTTPLARLGGIG